MPLTETTEVKDAEKLRGYGLKTVSGKQLLRLSPVG